MSEEAKLVPTWIYNAKGESKLVDHPAGAQAPKGWAFAPPAGVELEIEGNNPPAPAPLSTPMPNDDPRVAALEERVRTLESQIMEVGEFLDAMTAPSAETDDKAALLSRARELGIEGFDGRSKVEKIKAAIAEAEAKAKPDA